VQEFSDLVVWKKEHGDGLEVAERSSI